MFNPKIILETVNILTDPVCFNLFQRIVKKPIRFTDLLSLTGLSNHSLSKNLDQLSQYSLIKTDLGEMNDGKFAVYKVSEVGKKFQKILYEMISEFDETPQEVTGKFVLDANIFKKLYQKYNLTSINQIFRDSIIILTDNDFDILVQYADETKDNSLEDYLFDEHKIKVAKTYEEPNNGSRTEFYLRRAKKVPQEKAQLIATALDRKAGIILDDEKLIKYARQMGILTVKIEQVLQLEKNALREVFYELANSKDSTTPMEVINPQYYTKFLKKN